jgi:O-antigen/teichoic acid export membrane protein
LTVIARPQLEQGHVAVGPKTAKVRYNPFRRLAGIGRGRDYVLTFGTEFAVLSSSLLVLRLAATYWGPAGFGEFVLARRTINLVALPVLLGLGLAVTRYMAAAGSGAARCCGRAYALGATAIVAVTSAVALALFNIFARPLAVVLFSGAAYVGLVRSVSIAIVGAALHSVAYGVYRGRLEMGKANLLQFVNLALAPLLSLATPGRSPAAVVMTIGALWCAGAIVALVYALWDRSSTRLTLGDLKESGRELLFYGAPRFPGEIALGALFALPVTVAAHLGGMIAAAKIGVAVSILSMIGSVFSPVGHILLPTVTCAARGEGLAQIRVAIKHLLGLFLAATTVFVIAIEFVASPLLRIAIGQDFVMAAPIVRIVVVAAIPYIAYIVLRNVLDALHLRPLNAKNLLVALAVFAVLAYLSASVTGVALALGASILTLGLLSTWDARRLLRD